MMEQTNVCNMNLKEIIPFLLKYNSLLQNKDIATIKSQYVEVGPGEKEEAVLFRGISKFSTPVVCKALTVKVGWSCLPSSPSILNKPSFCLYIDPIKLQ
jgi:hypothetical protein